MSNGQTGQQRSRLLELWAESSRVADHDLTSAMLPISDDLQSLIDVFVMRHMLEPDHWTDDENTELVQKLAAEPSGFRYLRQQLRVAEQIFDAPETPVPSHQPDFSIRLSQRRIQYVGEPPRQIIRSTQLARSGSEASSVLKHEQTLKHCRVVITVEAAIQGGFNLRLEFPFVDPTYSQESLVVTLSNEPDESQHTADVVSQRVEFRQLTPGFWNVEITAGSTELGRFHAELQADDTSPGDT